jgi:hypothetical protein
MRSLRHRPAPFGTASALLVATFCLLPMRVRAAPAGGFVEHWPGTSVGGWTGGSIYANPGTGGAGGDGYLKVSTNFAARLGSFSTGAEYAGDWVTAGIVGVKVKLNDVGADQALEIHFSIGNRNNFWQYDTGFLPPNGSWAEFTVDLTNAANFTQTHGTGSFTDALANVDHVHFRHDVAPYALNPDQIAGDFGIDDLTLVGASTPVAAHTWGRLKALYR